MCPACSHAHVPCLHAYVPMCEHALHAYVLTWCLASLHAYVSMYLACFHAHFSTCLACLHALWKNLGKCTMYICTENIPSFLSCFNTLPLIFLVKIILIRNCKISER